MAKIPERSQRPRGQVEVRVATQSRRELGRVGRITKDARKSRKKRSRGTPYGAAETNHGAVTRRMVGLGLVLGGLVVTGLLVWTLLRQNPAPAPGPDTESPITILSGQPPTDSSIDAVQAVEAVAAMLDAESPEDLEPILIEGEISRDDAITKLRSLEKDGEGFGTPSWLGELDAMSEAISFVMVSKNHGSPLIVRLARDGDAGWKIDFDASVAHCTPPFSEWVEARPEQGLIRCSAEPDNYFNGPFADEDVWVCLALTHPEGDGTIYGYCRREGTQFDAIQEIQRRNLLAATERDFESGAHKSFRATLRCRTVEGGVSRQYEIVEVVSDEWVVGDESFESILKQQATARD